MQRVMRAPSKGQTFVVHHLPDEVSDLESHKARLSSGGNCWASAWAWGG
jgi:hypothetical protein